MNIVVTGVTGFLGGHLATSLIREGHTVVGAGRNRERAGLMEKQGARVLLGDIANTDFVFQAIAGADAVIHVAALSAPWGTRKAFFSANVTGTKNVVHACLHSRVGRLIHISSPSVAFSGQDVLRQTEAAPYPRKYLSFYSQSKKLGEDIVHESIPAGLLATIVRPKAIFGPGDTALLPRLVAAAKAGRLVQIGDGSNLVDLTYVANVVQSILLLLKTDRSIGKTYTVTNDQPVALWSVVRFALRETMGVASLRQVPYRTAFLLAAALEARAAITRREPPLTRYSVAILGRTQTYDINALKKDTGYTPKVSLEEGLAETIAALKRSN
jgi:nucleoside-diphosphate-sugar epimerase